jgi:hypothetical protein
LARLVILIGLGPIVAIGFLVARRDKIVAGHVVDCQTNAPIAGAGVLVTQSGWGFSNGSLVWDRSYVYRTTSDDTGRFSVTYNVGSSADILVEKKGYIRAQQYEEENSSISIRILRGDKPMERTYYCRLSSECYVTRMEGNVQVTSNVCLP